MDRTKPLIIGKMIMKITKKFLNEKSACTEGMEYVINNAYIGLPGKKFVEKLMSENKLEWANWLIVRIMTYKQYVSYAIFAAEQVIDIYEKKYPNDNRPRKVIEAAKLCIKSPIKKNKVAAAVAANAAADAITYTTITNAAAFAAANAAVNAFAAANTAAVFAAVNAFAAANTAAANAVAANAAAAAKKMKIKILNYGLSLIK